MINLLIAVYDDREEIILGSTNLDRLGILLIYLTDELSLQAPNCFTKISSLTGHHFVNCPLRFETRPVHVPLITHSLSRRELQIAEEITKGSSNSKIASLLGLAAKTVSTYRERVKDKLQLGSNVEIALFMRENGLA